MVVWSREFWSRELVLVCLAALVVGTAFFAFIGVGWLTGLLTTFGMLAGAFLGGSVGLAILVRYSRRGRTGLPTR